MTHWGLFCVRNFKGMENVLGLQKVEAVEFSWLCIKNILALQLWIL